jgi:hypothetical protein
MKSFIFSLLVFGISFIGFIVAPQLIFGVDMRHIPHVYQTKEGAWASEQLDKISESKQKATLEELRNLEQIIKSKEIVDRSLQELFFIGQNNYLWFSWMPVFLLFVLFSKVKKDLIYFSGVVIFFFIIGWVSINTLMTYLLAGLFGFSCKALNTKLRRTKVCE